MEKLYIILNMLASFLLIVAQCPVKLGGGGRQSQTAHLGPCTVYTRCGEAEEGMKSKFDACIAKISREHVTRILQEVGKSGVYEFSADDAISAFNEYCKLEYDTQLDVFDEFIKSIVGIYHTACENPLRFEECTSWNQLSECVMPDLDKLHNEGLCGCD